MNSIDTENNFLLTIHYTSKFYCIKQSSVLSTVYLCITLLLKQRMILHDFYQIFLYEYHANVIQFELEAVANNLLYPGMYVLLL